MCYSAQIQAAYLRYLRETGAEMDIDQFVEIFGARVSRILAFASRAPSSAGSMNRKMMASGRSRNSSISIAPAEITKLEREVFAQKKRLADAERTLASKPTKAAAESKRIAAQQDRAGA